MPSDYTIKRRTKYSIAKTTKMNNFTYLCETVCEKGQVVLLGDSITEIFNITDLFSDFSKKTGLSVYNRGISGDTSDRLLERIKDNVTSICPSVVVLLIGTNDLGVGCKPDFIVRNIIKTIETLKSDCPEVKIIVQSVYPVNKSINKRMVSRRKNSDIAEINRQLESVCKKENVVFLDLTEELSDSDGCFKKEYTHDGLHPNATGFHVVTKKLIPEIEKLI